MDSTGVQLHLVEAQAFGERPILRLDSATSKKAAGIVLAAFFLTEAVYTL